jgi:hypothetical protein
MAAKDTQVLRPEDALMIAKLRNVPLEPVESVFTRAAWIALRS